MSRTLRDYKIKKESLFEESNEKQKQDVINTSKGKVGRPKLVVKRKRKSILVYLYNDEYEKLKEIAKLEGLSTFIRGVLKDKFNI